MTREQIIELGYDEPKLLATGEWAALSDQLFTTGLFVGIDETGYRTRFCYEYRSAAMFALQAWDGRGDPPGMWIKQKGDVERLGPGALTKA